MLPICFWDPALPWLWVKVSFTRAEICISNGQRHAEGQQTEHDLLGGMMMDYTRNSTDCCKRHHTWTPYKSLFMFYTAVQCYIFSIAHFPWWPLEQALATCGSCGFTQLVLRSFSFNITVLAHLNIMVFCLTLTSSVSLTLVSVDVKLCDYRLIFFSCWPKMAVQTVKVADPCPRGW